MSELKQLQSQLKSANDRIHALRMRGLDYSAKEIEAYASRLRKQIKTLQKEQGITDQDETGKKIGHNHFSFWQRLRLLFTGKVPIREEIKDDES